MSDGFRIAVVGATGVVGETVLKLLSERGQLPIDEVVAFASPNSRGNRVSFGDRWLECQVLTDESVRGFDLVFSSAGGATSKDWAPKFESDGAIVIDKSSAMRMDEEVALVVPEVNGEVLDDVLEGRKRQIIASPNCSTMQLVIALNPIRVAVGLRTIVVSTYQSVSGTGSRAIRELRDQTEALLKDPTGDTAPAPIVYPHRIGFNVLPQVETFGVDDDGYTTEEMKMWKETCKIFSVEDPRDLPVTATCVRVPVMHCHSESILVETERPLSVRDCQELLENAPGVRLVDDPEQESYPLASVAAGSDDVFVGRIRAAIGNPLQINLWVVGDNLRKGAATNAVQIAEELHRRGLKRQASYRVAAVTSA